MTISRTFLLLCMVIAFTIPGNVIADDARTGQVETFTAPNSGITISFPKDGEAYFPDDTSELRQIDRYTEEVSWIYRGDYHISVVVLDGNVSPSYWKYTMRNMLVSYHQGWAELAGSEYTPDSGWLLAQGYQYLNLVEMTYSELTMDFEEDLHIVVTVWTDPAALVENVAWAKENVTVNGKPVLVDTDLDEIDAMMTGDSSYEPISLRFPHWTLEDWESEGLTSDSSWTAYYHPVSLTWDTDYWNVPLHHPEPLYHETHHYESGIALVREDSNARVWVHVASEPIDHTIEAEYELITSKSLLEDKGIEYPALGSKFTGDQGSVITYVNRPYDRVTIQIRETYFLSSGELVTVILETTPHNLASAYDDLITFLEIEGEHVQPTWTLEELDTIAQSFMDE